MKVEPIGYVLKDKKGRYFSSAHRGGSVKRLKDCDWYSRKEAERCLKAWNKEGAAWVSVVPVGLVECEE